MSATEKALWACATIAGLAVVLFAVVMLIEAKLSGPSTGDREAVGDAPDRYIQFGNGLVCAQCCTDEGEGHLDWCTYALPVAGCCRCYALDGEQHDPWCSRRPSTVVAGSDLDPLERLFAAPAYGEQVTDGQ